MCNVPVAAAVFCAFLPVTSLYQVKQRQTQMIILCYSVLLLAQSSLLGAGIFKGLYTVLCQTSTWRKETKQMC